MLCKPWFVYPKLHRRLMWSPEAFPFVSIKISYGLLSLSVPTATAAATTTRKHVRLPPRGVCLLFFGGFVVKTLKTSSFVWFSSARRCFGVFFHRSLLLFVGEVFAKVSQVPCCSSSFFFLILGSVAKFLFGKPQKHESFVLVAA